MRLHAITGGIEAAQTAPNLLPAYCFSTDIVGDIVYIMGPKVGLRYQVTKVDIDDPAKMPATGIIIRKSAPTDCTVQTGGILRGTYGALTPGGRLFVGADSRPKHAYTRPSSGLRLIQRIGHALSATDIVVLPEDPVIIYPPIIP